MGTTIEPMDASNPGAAVREATLEDQLAAFFDTHYERMVALAALICHSGVSPEDAVQAAMEQAWRRRATLRDALRLRWWLDRIVVREAIRLNRKPWRREVSANESQIRLLGDAGAKVGPDQLDLDAAFATLSVDQRAAVVLHLYAGYSLAETARMMDAPVETTRSRLRLARRRMRIALAEEVR